MSNTIKNLKKLKSFHNGSYGADIDKAVKALEQNPKYRKEAKRWKNKALKQQVILNEIRAEIERQEKWLWQAGINPYNVDIAFSAIKSAITESEEVWSDK